MKETEDFHGAEIFSNNFEKEDQPTFSLELTVVQVFDSTNFAVQ